MLGSRGYCAVSGTRNHRQSASHADGVIANDISRKTQTVLPKSLWLPTGGIIPTFPSHRDIASGQSLFKGHI